MATKSMKCDIKGTGLAAGLLWGAGVFGAGLLGSTVPGYMTGFITVVASVYPGYSATMPGAVIGGIFGFIDGVVGGAIFAYLYNYFSK